MRKCEKLMVELLKANESGWCNDNTFVTKAGEVRLFGNKIAWKEDNNMVLNSEFRGYSRTTTSRFNAIQQEFPGFTWSK